MIDLAKYFELSPKPLNQPVGPLLLCDFEAMIEAGCLVWLVGSQTIDGASKSDSDYDFLVACERRVPELFSSKLGFNLEFGAHYDPSEGQFNSWRKGAVNLIATDSLLFAKRFLAANQTAQELKLTERSDRVDLFKSILYPKTTLTQWLEKA